LAILSKTLKMIGMETVSKSFLLNLQTNTFKGTFKTQFIDQILYWNRFISHILTNVKFEFFSELYKLCKLGLTAESNVYSPLSSYDWLTLSTKLTNIWNISLEWALKVELINSK